MLKVPTVKLRVESNIDILLLCQDDMQLAGNRSFAVFASIIILLFDSADNPEYSQLQWIICYEYSFMALLSLYALVMFLEIY